MSVAVLDTSAVLAWLGEEPGADGVEPFVADAAMSAVNWSETAQKVAQAGGDARQVTDRLRHLGVAVEQFTVTDALAAATLWPATRAVGLSLGDRACLALAARLGLPAITADTAWKALAVGVDIRLVR